MNRRRLILLAAATLTALLVYAVHKTLPEVLAACTLPPMDDLQQRNRT